MLDGAHITVGPRPPSPNIVSFKKSSADLTYAAVLPLASFSLLQTVASSTEVTVYSRRSCGEEKAREEGEGGGTVHELQQAWRSW